MVRAPCCSKVGLTRGPWSAKEDALLADYIQQHGEGQWRSLPKKAGLLRCGKSCRLRWLNYLRPGIKRGNITEDEEDLIVRLHGLLGNRWSLIAGRLPGRTDNEIKNYWNTYLMKKLRRNHCSPKKIPKNATSATKDAVADDDSRNPRKMDKKKDVGKDEDVIIIINEGGGKGKAEADSVSGEVKLYFPKATRACSVLPRAESLDSFASGAAVAPGMNWDFGLGDGAGYYGGFCDVDGSDFHLVPTLTSRGSMSSDDVGMLDLVYDEYFQLL